MLKGTAHCKNEKLHFLAPAQSILMQPILRIILHCTSYEERREGEKKREESDQVEKLEDGERNQVSGNFIDTPLQGYKHYIDKINAYLRF